MPPIPTSEPLHPARTVVVVTGGDTHAHWPGDARLAFDPELAAALPAASRVLEIGPGTSALAAAYKRVHGGAHWSCVGMAALPDTQAGGVDAAYALDAEWAAAVGPCDLLVVNGVLAALPDAPAVLTGLAACAAPGAALLVDVDNHGSWSTLARWLDGDLGAAWAEQPLAAQPRLHSLASAYRLLLDAGWMPHLLARREEPAPQRQALQAWVQPSGLASAGAAPLRAMNRLVIASRRWAEGAAPTAGHARFDVLVPTTDERQLRINVEQSPGLREVGARIVSCRGAATAANAWQLAQPQLTADWVLMCHQDVYFPAGFGQRLAALLDDIAPADRAHTLLGFIGLGARAGGGTAPAGFVIDRMHRADHPASDRGVSIDEVALVMARETVHRIDPSLGWHLWATDLCLQAICQHRVFARIERAPLFHNSRTGWTLPAAFRASARRLVDKWGAQLGPIPTLCGAIDDAFLAQPPVAP